MPESSRVHHQAAGPKGEKKKAASRSAPVASTLTKYPVKEYAGSAGNAGMLRLLGSHTIQAKLTVSQPGDASEREADTVAARVMRMAEPESAMPATPPLVHRANGSPIQR